MFDNEIQKQWFLACLRDKQRCLSSTISQCCHRFDGCSVSASNGIVQLAMAEQRYRDVHCQGLSPPASSSSSSSSTTPITTNQTEMSNKFQEIINHIRKISKPPPSMESILLVIQCIQDGLSNDVIRLMLDTNDILMSELQLIEISDFIRRMEFSDDPMGGSCHMRSFQRCLQENSVHDVKLYLSNPLGITELGDSNITNSSCSNFNSKSTHTALTFTASLGYCEVINTLLDHDTNNDGNWIRINQCNKLGQTALHVASNANHVDAVRLLLRRGANVYVRDNYGNLALHYACKMGHVQIMHLLASHAHEQIHTLLRGSWTLQGHVEGALSIQNVASLFKKILEHHGSDFFRTVWCWDIAVSIYSNHIVTHRNGDVECSLPQPMEDVMDHVLSGMYATELSGVWSVDGAKKLWVDIVPSPGVLQTVVYLCFQYSVVNQSNNLGCTALHLACIEDRHSSHLDVIKAMALTYYSLLDRKDKKNQTPLDHLRRKHTLSSETGGTRDLVPHEMNEKLDAIAKQWDEKVKNKEKRAILEFKETLESFCKQAEKLDTDQQESSLTEENDSSNTALPLEESFRMLDQSTLTYRFSLHDEYCNRHSDAYFYLDRYLWEKEEKATVIQIFYREKFHFYSSTNLPIEETMVTSAISFNVPKEVLGEKRLIRGWELMRERSNMLHIQRLSMDEREWIKYNEPASGQEFYWCPETRQYCWDLYIEDSNTSLTAQYVDESVDGTANEIFARYLLDNRSNSDQAHFDSSNAQNGSEAFVLLYFLAKCQQKNYHQCRWGCGSMVRLGSRHQSFHEQKICSRRIVQCTLGCPLHLTEGQWKKVSKDPKDNKTILQWHQGYECPKRLVVCDYCHFFVAFDALEHHKSDECPHRPATKICHCRLGCGAEFRQFTKVEMEQERQQHEEDFCPERIEVCEWKGCYQELKHKFMREHVLSHIRSRGISTFQEPGIHIYRVPRNTPKLLIRIWGAGGGGSGNENETLGGSYGGGGAFVEALVHVSAEEVLVLWVGHGGHGGRSKCNISHFQQTEKCQQIGVCDRTRGISSGSKWAGGYGGEFSAVMRRQQRQNSNFEHFKYHMVLLAGGGGGGGVRNGDPGCIHDQISPGTFEWQDANSLINEKFLVENYAGGGGGTFICPGITRGGSGGKCYVDGAYSTGVTLQSFQYDESSCPYGRGGRSHSGRGESGSDGRIEIGIESYFSNS